MQSGRHTGSRSSPTAAAAHARSLRGSSRRSFRAWPPWRLPTWWWGSSTATTLLYSASARGSRSSAPPTSSPPSLM